MQTQKPPRRHHFVPYFYLRYFSQEVNGKEAVWVYDKKTLEVKDLHPVNTAVQTNLYTVSTTQSPRDTSLETDGLARDEAEAKKVLDRLVPAEEPIELTRQEIQVLAAFMAIMHVRVPRHIASTKEFAEKHFIETLKLEVQDHDKTQELLDQYARENPTAGHLSLEEYENFCETLGTDYRLNMNEKRAMIHSFLTMKDIYLELLKFDWLVLEAPRADFFITCDAPLVTFVPTGNGKALFGAGFGRHEAQISFPISPKKCLFLSREKTPDIGYAMGLARELNRRCANMAYRFVYSPYKSDRIMEMTKEFSGTVGRSFINQQKVAEMVKKHRLLDADNSSQGRRPLNG